MEIVIATGGTGGHVFPAQALAKELLAKGYTVTFIGGGLHCNRYFHRAVFNYHEVAACPFSKWNPFRFCFRIVQGLLQSLKLLKRISPKLVIGFGSFYTFPVLLAAYLKKIPFFLFEPNAIPGKVNRFFSRWAHLTALQFDEARAHLKGPVISVKMPLAKSHATDTPSAREYFYLKPDLFTFLVFGGSQGAQSINQLFAEAASEMQKDFQVIHVTGQTESAEILRRFYSRVGIVACVKAFEERMDLAWSAASAAVCRAGAATVAEQIKNAVPALYIPFPKATDDHQMKNAQVVETTVKGAFVCSEQSLTLGKLKGFLSRLLLPEEREKMHQSMQMFGKEKEELCDVVVKLCSTL